MKDLKNKVVLLTGASSGIGSSLTVLLASKGAKLALCARSEERLLKVAESCTGEKLFARAFCVTQENEVQRFVADTVAHYGQIDILINNAGVNTAKSSVLEIKTSDLEWMLKVNLVAPVVFMREVLGGMQARKSGHILNVLSTTALFSNAGVGSYSASKSGLDAMTKIVRKEVRAHGIQVTSVYPGGVNTTFRANERSDYMSPQTVAEVIVGALETNDDAAMHEIVFRPMVEEAFF